MRKIGKVMRIVTASLLCLTFATTSMVSSTFAKYTATGTSTPTSARVAAWGMNIESDSQLVTSYSDSNGKLVVNAQFDSDSNGSVDNMLAPGTSGRLMWFHVWGDAEVSYKVDFTGTFNFGLGFWSRDSIEENREYAKQSYINKIASLLCSSEEYTKEAALEEATTIAESGNATYPSFEAVLALKDQCKFFDEYGKEIDYFPIAIYCIPYDVAYDNDKNMILTENTSLKNALNGSMNTRNCLQRVDGNGNEHQFFSGGVWAGMLSMDKSLNGHRTDGKYPERAISAVFDSNQSDGVHIDRYYAIDWCWPYNSADTYKGKGSGTEGTYQTKELDTILGEFIAQYPSLFTIMLDMTIEVSQTN
ncbi:MAG: hypothetical protein J6U68_02955 [Clostridia bacterium]|nr:hypothetical protein [Clostridia bacterium]